MLAYLHSEPKEYVFILATMSSAKWKHQLSDYPSYDLTEACLLFTLVSSDEPYCVCLILTVRITSRIFMTASIAQLEHKFQNIWNRASFICRFLSITSTKCFFFWWTNWFMQNILMRALGFSKVKTTGNNKQIWILVLNINCACHKHHACYQQPILTILVQMISGYGYEILSTLVCWISLFTQAIEL